MTVEELDRLPDDGNRYELIDGELFVTPAPRTRHQQISSRLHNILGPFAENHRLGSLYAAPTDVYLEPNKPTRVEPDLLFVSTARNFIIGDDAIHGAPDLVVEILSESSARTDRFEKRDLYQRAGVDEYWIVDPYGLEVTVYRFNDSDKPRIVKTPEVLSTPLLPGLEIPLEKIFEPIR